MKPEEDLFERIKAAINEGRPKQPEVKIKPRRAKIYNFEAARKRRQCSRTDNM